MLAIVNAGVAVLEGHATFLQNENGHVHPESEGAREDIVEAEATPDQVIGNLYGQNVVLERSVVYLYDEIAALREQNTALKKEQVVLKQEVLALRKEQAALREQLAATEKTKGEHQE